MGGKGGGDNGQAEAQMALMREQMALSERLAAKPPNPNPPVYSDPAEGDEGAAFAARQKERKRMRSAVNTVSTMMNRDYGGGKKLLGE